MNVDVEAIVREQAIKEDNYFYPLFKNMRVRGSNLERIKARATRYGESADDILTRLLDQLDYYERLGYPTPNQDDGGSW